MKKGQLVSLLKTYGDGIIHSKDASIDGSLVTVDFKTKYIKTTAGRKKPWPGKGLVVVFSWNHSKYIFIDPTLVYRVTPLSEILKNEKP